MIDNLRIEHLSYSSINLFLTCSEAWRRKYIEKEPTISTPALVFGSAFHKTIEEYITNRASDYLMEFDMFDLWSWKWDSTLEQNPDCEWGADSPEFHFNEGVRMLSNPELVQTLNKLRPLEDEAGLFMERKIELNVPGVPVPVIGYIDIVTNDGVPGDFKTSKYAWNQDKAQQEIQPLAYLAALNQLGMDSPGLRFRHIVITKAKQSKVQVIETQHTYDSIFWFYGLVQRVWQAIENESYVMNPGSWLCGPKYCSFWSTCRGRGL